MSPLTCRASFAAVSVWILSSVCVFADETPQSAESVAPSLASYSAEERKFQDALYLKMQRPVEWRLADESLSGLADRLRKELDTEVLVDEQALEDVGIGDDQTFRGSYSRISLQQALEHLLNRYDLDWTICGKALVISSQEEIEQQLLVRVYDVRDLVVSGNFGQADFDMLIDLIISQVASDTWAENGGGEAEVRPFHADDVYALVVTQTFHIHRQIEKLLSDLRQLRGEKGAAAQPAISWEELQAKLKLFNDESASEPSSEESAATTPLVLGSPELEDAIARCNDFSLDLFRKVAGDPDRNRLISGYSAREMLALASYGANGATRQQFEQVLRLPSSRQASAVENLAIRSSLRDRSPGNELLVANAVWVERGLPIQPKFRSLAKNYMQATVRPIDFAASTATADEINRWAAENTRNRITKVVDGNFVEQSEPCLLTNAVYFLGKWESSFSKDDTKPRDFRLPSGQFVQVPTMQGHVDARGAVDEETGIAIGELYYAGKKKSMVLLLPADGNGALEELVRSLTHEKLQGWLGELSAGSINVELPKFHFQGYCELRPALTELGLRDAFDSTIADFSGIAAQGLFLQCVRQYTFIRVDETGTEAAAVTGGTFGGRIRPVTDLIVNHPFLFLIRDVKTGCILFVGRVVDPRHA